MTVVIPPALQTAYADLLDRCMSSAFKDAVGDGAAFTSKKVRGRRYWYAQTRIGGKRRQRYVGPETPELLERIAGRRAVRDHENDRRALVSMLVRSAHLPRPLPTIGAIVAALAEAGFFRLRGVMVGTVAYQTYPAMLGIRLPGAAMQTLDVDIAQFADVSVAVGDAIPTILDLLRRVDPTFRPVMHVHDARRATTYAAANGIRVDFLTPNRGPDSDEPPALPALRTDAQQLRFLDFLIREPEPAVVLHGAGVHVMVPAPQRFALHKLIVARRRAEGAAKRDKDLRQAGALLAALTRMRPRELRAAWEEARGRGKTWRSLLGEGLGAIDPDVRDRTLMTVGACRAEVPGLDLRFASLAARWDADREAVTFLGESAGGRVNCAIARKALEDIAAAESLDRRQCLRTFRDHRAAFENAARRKYLTAPIDDLDCVLVDADDLDR